MDDCIVRSFLHRNDCFSCKRVFEVSIKGGIVASCWVRVTSNTDYTTSNHYLQYSYTTKSHKEYTTQRFTKKYKSDSVLTRNQQPVTGNLY